MAVPIVPSPIPLPPAKFDHPYTGKLTILKPDDYALISDVCSDSPNPIACAFRTFDTITGETLACLIMLGLRCTMMSVHCGMSWDIAMAGGTTRPCTN